MKKIILITNIPTPYRIPLFNVLKDRMNSHDMELVVVFAASGYKRRLAKTDMQACRFRYHVLGSKPFNPGRNNEKTVFFYSGLRRFLNKEKPYRIIVSGFSPATLKLWLYSFIYGFRYIIWSGSISRKGRNDSAFRILMRRLLTARSSAFVAYGSLAAEYLQELGAADDKIFIGINTVDTKLFASVQRKPAASPRRLLYTGYLVPRKNVKQLIEVCALVLASGQDVAVDILGDGESREELEALVKQKGLTGRIIFHGFKQQHELHAFLSGAYAFLFQTGFDIWGLSLVEAMAAGLPCFSSVNAGATYDLINDGVTGFSIDFNETEKAADRIIWLLANEREAEQTGNNAKAFIAAKANLETSAEGFIKAIAVS
jgi:glycosyltransferase involved in cell wall biosynthesis